MQHNAARFSAMKKSITLLVVVSALFSAVAQEQTSLDFLNPEFFDSPSSPQTKAIPTFVILPGDVVQNSVMRMWSSDHRLAVRWTFTEAGAKKALAFWESHREQTIRTVVAEERSETCRHFEYPTITK
jgi:hypothetical protein